MSENIKQCPKCGEKLGPEHQECPACESNFGHVPGGIVPEPEIAPFPNGNPDDLKRSGNWIEPDIIEGEPVKVEEANQEAEGEQQDV